MGIIRQFSTQQLINAVIEGLPDECKKSGRRMDVTILKNIIKKGCEEVFDRGCLVGQTYKVGENLLDDQSMRELYEIDKQSFIDLI